MILDVLDPCGGPVAKRLLAVECGHQPQLIHRGWATRCVLEQQKIKTNGEFFQPRYQIVNVLNIPHQIPPQLVGQMGVSTSKDSLPDSEVGLL